MWGGVVGDSEANVYRSHHPQRHGCQREILCVHLSHLQTRLCHHFLGTLQMILPLSQMDQRLMHGHKSTMIVVGHSKYQ
jgi:hypothetical protein